MLLLVSIDIAGSVLTWWAFSATTYYLLLWLLVLLFLLGFGYHYSGDGIYCVYTRFDHSAFFDLIRFNLIRNHPYRTRLCKHPMSVIALVR